MYNNAEIADPSTTMEIALPWTMLHPYILCDIIKVNETCTMALWEKIQQRLHTQLMQQTKSRAQKRVKMEKWKEKQKEKAI